jgi:uridylate kinase
VNPLSELKYKRILLKISGEALGENVTDNLAVGLDFGKIHSVCEAVKACHDMGVQIGLVIGGGNFWRGVKNGSGKMQRSHGDAMGMLATVMNAIAVADVLEQHGMDARVLTAVEMHKFAEYFTRDTANRYLNEGKVVLFAAGTGNPYFSTDTGAVLRGVEIEADAVLMAKNIDGIYSADPHKDPTAVKFDELTYGEVLEKGLKATDVTAMALAMDNNMPMVCFGLAEENSIVRVVRGEKIGTTVTN